METQHSSAEHNSSKVFKSCEIISLLRHLQSSVCPAESAEGDAADVPAENPAERERSSAAERDGGVSEGESGEEEKFVSVSVQTH